MDPRTSPDLRVPVKIGFAGIWLDFASAPRLPHLPTRDVGAVLTRSTARMPKYLRRRGPIGAIWSAKLLFVRDHHDADRRSLALHAEVARRVRANPELRERARERLSRISPAYREAWTLLLGGPLERLLEALTDESEAATALRQASPFSFALDPKTRQRILRETVVR